MTNSSNWQTSISIKLSDLFEKHMREMQENNICFMELTGGNRVLFENYKEKSRYYFDTAANYGVKIRSVHLPFSPFEEIDPASADARIREEFISLQRELIGISAQCGAEIAVVHPSGEPYSDATRGENLKRSIESMSILGEIAKENGMLLAVENLPRSCILRDCAEIEAFKAQIPDVHFVFDSNHSLRDSNEDIINAMGNRIIATHISDYDFVDEKHWLPGEGKNDWQKIIQCLEQVDYSGTWNYEIGNCIDIDIREIADNRKTI